MYELILISCIISGIILLIVSIIFNVILLKGSLNSLKKVELYEEWVNELKDRVEKAHAKMKAIDDHQMFEKDDDVGVAFKEIYDIIKDLNDETK